MYVLVPLPHLLIQPLTCLDVESRKGHVFCNMCKDFVFDPTLEALRTKKVETGSFAGCQFATYPVHPICRSDR